MLYLKKRNMGSVNSFFDSFKEFIWDIIGFLLPGSYLLIILTTCVNQEYLVPPSFGTSTEDFSPVIFIFLSYLVGHVVFGFSCLKEKILGKYSYVKKIEAKVADGRIFNHSKTLILRMFQSKGIIEDFSTSTVRDLRNIAMSFIPEQDQKIYTFTFRAALSNQTANISLSIGILGLIFTIFSFIPWSIFKTDTAHILVYICLILCYFFLRQTRNRFYAISVGLPFSIYIAKAIQQ